MLKTKKTRRTSVDLGMNKDTWGVVNNNGLDIALIKCSIQLKSRFQ